MHRMKKLKNIYFDYQATTPVDPRVLKKMMPYFSEIYGNPHSRNHSFGWEAEAAIEVARENVAKIIGASPKEVIFTSGATESNNLAIKGLADFYGDKKNHIITCVTEHKCVLESCRQLNKKGFDVTYLPVQQNGLIDLDFCLNCKANLLIENYISYDNYFNLSITVSKNTSLKDFLLKIINNNPDYNYLNICNIIINYLPKTDLIKFRNYSYYNFI